MELIILSFWWICVSLLMVVSVGNIPLLGLLNGLTLKFSDTKNCENNIVQLFRGNYGFSLVYKISSAPAQKIAGI